jgi:hypothetical protein
LVNFIAAFKFFVAILEHFSHLVCWTKKNQATLYVLCRHTIFGIVGAFYMSHPLKSWVALIGCRSWMIDSHKNTPSFIP